MNLAAQLALRDIAEEVKYTEDKVRTLYSLNGVKYWETWICYGENLYNSEQRRLNRQLGISYIHNGGSPNRKKLFKPKR